MADHGDGHSALPLFDPFDESSYFANFAPYPNVQIQGNSNFVPGEPSSRPPPSFSPDRHQPGNVAPAQAFDPPDDPLIWVANADLDLMGARGETNSSGEEEGVPQQPPPGGGFGSIVQMPLQPLPHTPVPLNCSFCQVLREIIHTNGSHATKLEIHGRLGMICHAILEDQQNQECRMFDFVKQGIDSVKQFLLQYCEERRQAGYVMLQDPLLIFYEALCTGLDCDEDFNIDELFQSSPIDVDLSNSAEVFQANEQEAEEHTDRGQQQPKSSLAMQRERAAKLTMKEVGMYFNVPIEEAARKVGVCPTVVKKICRKHGVYRWPHRKIKSIERKESILKASLNSTDAEVRARAQDGIERLRAKMNEICAGVT